jgi:CubicO group peptidase (beta-lactamase class C family)
VAESLEQRMFTAASMLVSVSGEIVLEEGFGTLGDRGKPTRTDTLFDLASVTKILATTPAWMILAAQDASVLDTGIGAWFFDCPEDKQSVTPRLLLAHCSGLPAWRPYYLLTSRHPSREHFIETKIFSEKLAYDPGADCLYSDLGFMLLGFLVEAVSGTPLAQFTGERVFRPLEVGSDVTWSPPGDEERIAPTRSGDPPGMVHDLNARRLGGVAGHAGLFGTSRGVWRIGQEVLNSLKGRTSIFDPAIVRAFVAAQPYTPPTARGLGFDLSISGARPSCGPHFSRSGFGHTGFTGTSMWIDPERELIVVILTNRVYQGESDFRIKRLRPALHSAVIRDL